MSPATPDMDPATPGPQIDPAAESAEQYTVDSAAAALAQADAQRFYQDGGQFEAVSQWLQSRADGLRGEIRRLEQPWQGVGADAFAAAAEKYSQQIDGFVDILSAPSYLSLMGQLGDALATAQRQISDLQSQRQQARDALAADPKAAGDPAAQTAHQQQEKALDEHAQQIMAQLGAAYRQIGGQFREFAQRSTGAAEGSPASSGNANPSAGASSGPAAGSGGANTGVVSSGTGVRAATPSAGGDSGVLGRSTGSELSGGASATDASPASLSGGVFATASPSSPVMGLTGAGVVGKSQDKSRSAQTDLSSVDPNMLELSQPTLESSGGQVLSADTGRTVTSPSVPMSVGSDGQQDQRSRKQTLTALSPDFRTASALEAGMPGGAFGNTAQSTTGAPGVQPAPATVDTPAPASSTTAATSASGSRIAVPSGSVGGALTNPALADDVLSSVPTSANLPRAEQLPTAATPPGTSAATGGSPLMPPMTGAGAADGSSGERNHNTLNLEETDTWDSTSGVPGGVLGR
ncbi:hypothetical protein MOQ72_08550 [Saccharopolyspora sp. K220]|uniref:flagellar export protein FliJ n=1 Tax=Saccharopolyspora soli TaxID=2926618 RepID=UPI001F5926FF|nr:flagellar export protein FliJ [Saccharopolyspora soli]MCI2417471.1 hypothetical protein [Saccharopolyspora soli]